MAKSKIIKDLANGTIDTATALKRTKVLLSELNDSQLLHWVNCELTGYSDDEELPDYRVVYGQLVGSYFKGSMTRYMQWTNVSLPLGNMPEELQEALLSIRLSEGVSALQNLSKQYESNDSNFGKVVPADLFPYIAKWNNDLGMIITSARVIAGKQCLDTVFSAVESRLLDVLLLLEREFGILDDLDIDTSSKSCDEMGKISEQLHQIIFNDYSISIGDGNKIKGTSILSGQSD